MAWKMRKTYCTAHMEFVDVSAIADSIPTTTFNQPFANINLLKEETYTPINNLASTDLNHFVLNGDISVMENTNVIAFMSKNQSDDNCLFANNPVIDIGFTKSHTSSGITFYFGFDYPTEIKLTWYSLDNTMLHQETFYPDSLNYTCKAQISNYGRLTVEIIKTRFPREYASIQHVKYGIMLNWGGEKITSANILEEVDVTSNTLSINTANISILDSNNDFDIANDNGAWTSVQKTQEITLTEYIDDKAVEMGTFFLDDSSFNDNIASFTLIDSIGLMAQYTYYNGRIYVNEKVGVILDDIFSCANIKKYTIDDEIYNQTVSGWLQVQTCREALQMVCFSIGAIADDSRSDTIKISYPDKYAKHTIEKERKFNGASSVVLDDFVSGVSIGYSTYQLSNKMSEIFNGTLPVGDTKITFSKPYDASSISATIGNITEVSTNYLIINNATEQDCVISGEQYEEIKSSYVLNGELEASETDNIVEHSGCTLVNTKLLPSVANKLLNYYKLRKSVSVEYIMDDEMVGQWVNIMTRENYLASSLIESQNVNLTGGFITTASCRGYSKVTNELIFTGELFAYDSIEGGAIL